jgi:hypothetical protein
MEKNGILRPRLLGQVTKTPDKVAPEISESI